jgi:TonB-linked SusC/RagA family outer membrane protein
MMTKSGLSLRWCNPPSLTALLARGSLAVGALWLGLALIAAPASGQGTVNGRVTVAGSGRPIAGAQVTVVGTNIGTTTGEDGQFVLVNVPVGRQEIRVAQIGYRVGLIGLNVQMGAITAETIELTRTVLRLDEVVVTGTAGQARRREVGNSIAQLEIAEAPDPPSSIETMLQGRAAGVNLTLGGGASGAGGTIRLRGAVSVSQSNQPIIYIDGVRTRSEGYRRNRPVSGYTGRSANVQQNPINDIDPADIERIEIIKGSAATTLYGTEASAGVIQIFTKKGRVGAPRWTFQMDQGFARMRPFGTEGNPYLNLKPASYAVFATDAEATLGGGSCADVAPNQDCSWLRNGYRSKYAGSVGGGVEGLSYFIAGSYSKYDGVLPNDTESKYSARGNFSFDVMNNVRIDWNTQYTSSNVGHTAQGNNAHGLTLNVYRQERNYFQSNDPRDLRKLLNQEIDTDINRLVTGVTVNVTPYSWFTNRYTLGYDFAHQELRNLRPFGFVRAPSGILGQDQIYYQTLTSDYVGNMNYGLTGSLRGTFSFGGQSILTKEVRTSAYGESFAGPGVPEVDDGSIYVTAGFFLQNMFDVNNKLFLTTGLRVDGHSAFGKNLGLQAYPKFSLSYVISDESFYPASLGELKLRSALGYSGRAPGTFAAIRIWNPEPTSGQPGYEPGNIGNDDVGPERTRELEFGFDAGLFDQRVSLEFTWYEQKTTDALMDVQQLPSLGNWDAQAANVGVLRNRGIEVNVNAQVVDAPDWGIELGGSFYTNESEVLALGEAVPFESGDGWVEEGWPIMAARGYMVMNPDEIADPIVVQDTIFGPSQPTLVVNPSVTIRLPMGIQLSARGEYRGGYYIQDGASFNALSRAVIWPTCREAGAYDIIDANRDAGRALEDGLTARQRVECIQDNTDSDYMYFKADFFKLRDLTLRVPMEWAIPKTSSATLSLTVQNWARWLNDDMRIFDPEMGERNTVSESGVLAFQEAYPPPGIFTASLRITF